MLNPKIHTCKHVFEGLFFGTDEIAPQDVTYSPNKACLFLTVCSLYAQIAPQIGDSPHFLSIGRYFRFRRTEIRGLEISKKENSLKTCSPIYLALDMFKLSNAEESFHTMREAKPRVCFTTATHPELVGFPVNIQARILSLAGHCGGASIKEGKYLNFGGNYRHSTWKHRKDHDAFHVKQFDGVFELRGGCLSTVVDGPWEPLYRTVKAKMPPSDQ